MASTTTSVFEAACACEPAILGGPAAVDWHDPAREELFHWPIVTEEDEQAVLAVLRAGTMSGTDITMKFEKEFAAWIGTKHALAACNGTSGLLTAMWACGVGAGDEVICPSLTYWASAAPALHLGATVHFVDVHPETLCIDIDDLEHRIGPQTKAIVAVHYAGHPCDMDPLLAIAKRHGIRVIEDNSHAQGAYYKGRRTGSMGDIAAMSMMAGKSFAIGEGGMITTNDDHLLERCIAFGTYERTGRPTLHAGTMNAITDVALREFAGLPIGAVKNRLNQTCAAMGRVQLKYYDARCQEIQKASDRFWSLLADTPGIHRHWPTWENSDCGGMYACRAHYDPAALGGLPVAKFCEAVGKEGVAVSPGANFPLHLHNYFHKADIFNQGQPTALAFGQRDVRQGIGSLPNTERVSQVTLSAPWFKHDTPELIEQHAAAWRKVALNAKRIAAM